MAKAIKMRVPIPENVGEIINLSEGIYATHLAKGAASPLNSMEDHDWGVLGPTIPQAAQLHKKAGDLKREMEKAFRERDLLIGPLDEANKASRDLLTGVYRKNMKRMGDWGFTVDDTPKVKKEPKKP